MKSSPIDTHPLIAGLKLNRERLILVLCLALLIGLYAYIVPATWRITGTDYNDNFAPAARALVTGHNPYTAMPNFRNPIWALLPFVPLVFLPQDVSILLLFILSLAVYIFIGLRLRARPIAFTAFLLSTSVLHGLTVLNIDAFVLLGFVMPAPIGLFLVLAKPQIGIGMALYWLIEAFRVGGLRKVVITFAPVTITLAITWILFGNWVDASSDALLITSYWNYSIFPWGIPIGLALFFAAILLKRKYLAAMTGPLFSPYVALPSWSALLVGLLDNDLLMSITVLALWILNFLHGPP
jgi:hypothetical protein